MSDKFRKDHPTGSKAGGALGAAAGAILGAEFGEIGILAGGVAGHEIGAAAGANVEKAVIDTRKELERAGEKAREALSNPGRAISRAFR